MRRLPAGEFGEALSPSAEGAEPIGGPAQMTSEFRDFGRHMSLVAGQAGSG